MRSDQLIMQMISLLGSLMRGLNLDLQLTVYQVLAFSSVNGIMECVDNSHTVQDLEKEYTFSYQTATRRSCTSIYTSVQWTSSEQKGTRKAR
jgi:phosphatidylinositol kinase/protein kinase (PI-3  family)